MSLSFKILVLKKNMQRFTLSKLLQPSSKNTAYIFRNFSSGQESNSLFLKIEELKAQLGTEDSLFGEAQVDDFKEPDVPLEDYNKIKSLNQQVRENLARGNMEDVRIHE
jgi:hypothetical protein